MQKNTDKHLAVLDGLRFFAALSVIMAHYTFFVIGDQGIQNGFSNWLCQVAAIGMPLFFVLSGFVIHYNYRNVFSQPGGLKNYFVARFTRLYPLYIALFAMEFAICFHYHNGSCGAAGDRCGLFLALPYYITLTQDWVYGIIGHNSLIYQYTLLSGVAWSISLEFFFYLSYLFFVKWLNKQNDITKQILIMLNLQIAILVFLLCCNHFSNKIEHISSIAFGTYATVEHGYQDSLLRWLYYFNPLVNVPAFFFGTTIANFYLKMKDKPLSRIEQIAGGWITCFSIAVTLAAFIICYETLGQTHLFIGRTGTVLYAPLIAVTIFCLVRYPSTWLNKFFSWSLFVKLGNASFSIYLLHAFFGRYPRDFYHLGLNPWVLYALSIISILIISRLCYLLYERPMQRWLRKIMLRKDKQPDINEPSIPLEGVKA